VETLLWGPQRERPHKRKFFSKRGALNINPPTKIFSNLGVFGATLLFKGPFSGAKKKGVVNIFPHPYNNSQKGGGPLIYITSPEIYFLFFKQPFLERGGGETPTHIFPPNIFF